MQKFENVDVIAALGEIMRQNTAFYQSDFDIDKGIIQRAAASNQAVDKTLLWMSRPSGTYCFRERDVFLKDTRQHNTCCMANIITIYNIIFAVSKIAPNNVRWFAPVTRF